MTLAAGVVGGYRWRLRSVEARNRALAVEVAERTLQIAQRTADIEALYQADAELDRHVALSEVLQSLVDIAVDELGAEKSAVLCWDKSRERLVMRVARGFSPEAVRQLSFAPGEGVTGQVMVTGEPAVVEGRDREPAAQDESPEVVALALAEGIRSFMHLPIKLDSGVFGVFNVSFTQPRGFGEREEEEAERVSHRWLRPQPSLSKMSAISTQSTGGPTNSASSMKWDAISLRSWMSIRCCMRSSGPSRGGSYRGGDDCPGSKTTN